jgi:hypothetical protein
MSESNVKIKVKIGANEVEIDAPLSSLKEAVLILPDLIQNLPHKMISPPVVGEIEDGSEMISSSIQKSATNLPEIRVEKDDSLPTVITKFFQDPWGKQPRRLYDVREVLESYGLIYPKQSVAVALLRLAKEGKLRRFKGEDGEFIYTASTSLSSTSGDPERVNINQEVI